jgi:hypothetical protein
MAQAIVGPTCGVDNSKITPEQLDRHDAGLFPLATTGGRSGPLADALGYLADTKRAIPNAAAAANPPITMVRNALGTSDIPV